MQSQNTTKIGVDLFRYSIQWWFEKNQQPLDDLQTFELLTKKKTKKRTKGKKVVTTIAAFLTLYSATLPCQQPSIFLLLFNL